MKLTIFFFVGKWWNSQYCAQFLKKQSLTGDIFVTKIRTALSKTEVSKLQEFWPTCSIPQAKIHYATTHRNVSTEVVKHSWNIILFIIREHSWKEKERKKQNHNQKLMVVEIKMQKTKRSSYRWESIACVGNQHARLPYRAIAYGHTFDEPSGAHFINIFSLVICILEVLFSDYKNSVPYLSPFIYPPPICKCSVWSNFQLLASTRRIPILKIIWLRGWAVSNLHTSKKSFRFIGFSFALSARPMPNEISNKIR